MPSKPVLIVILGMVIGLLWPVNAQAAFTVPPGFVDQTVVGGMPAPTAIDCRRPIPQQGDHAGSYQCAPVRLQRDALREGRRWLQRGHIAGHLPLLATGGVPHRHHLRDLTSRPVASVLRIKIPCTAT